ncbi:sensor histidine kinase [Parerythrobacter jejuensis]|uniref:histidine kinase n=1 Tax=Parerythrobacter jejuensis TaxID=795812 RepID=A0A845AUF5_9SPHN|nr:HAMP domain-containing sensor histidine kinase [Parerythrobacter jejuensis]MXP32441.1 sensor histidine kinase [Parerythrobacter jejuensis]
MTVAPDTTLARARTDGSDHLVEADDLIAGLQHRCGGEIPGAIAIHELRKLVKKAREMDLRLARTIRAFDGEERITAWVEVTPYEGASESGCAISVATWQTSKPTRETEDDAAARRDAIDNALAELHARLDPEQGILTVDSDAEDLQDLVNEMLANPGKPWTDFVTVAGNHHAQPLHWRLLDQSRCEIDGSPRQWTARLIPVGAPEPGSDGFELYLVADRAWVTRTSRRRAENDTVQAQLGRDLSPVLRQPISRIIANAETIRTKLAGPLTDEYSDYAADIASAGQHLLSLIDDLSDLEVIEAEGFTTAPDRIDLGDVARQAAGILGVSAQEKSIEIVAPPKDQICPATGEFRRVLQVLLNLIGNAIRYAPEGSRIRIELAHNDKMAGARVIDEGEGMSAEQQAVIFEKFERLGRSGDGGSGLGLYISRRLARAMGGELTVDSVEGEGATFTLMIPSAAEAN